jgi:mannitol-1-/sugar-/sorbitol-6-phosphatase
MPDFAASLSPWAGIRIGEHMALEIGLRCAAVLFDLDGVLVNSAACVEATWHRWASQHHLDPGVVIATAHGRRTIDTVRLVAPHLLAESEVAALGASESMTTAGIYEVPGARSLVDHLPLTA